MKRLSKQELGLIKELNNKGLSLRVIQEKTSIPLSTIQYNLNKNKTTKRIKSIKLPSSDFLIGELIGAFAGDGCYYHDKNGRSSKHFIRYTLAYKEKDYAQHLVSILKNMGLNVGVYSSDYKGEPSSIEIRTSSLRLLEFIKNYLCLNNKKTYSIRLLRDIKNYSANFLLGFARGLMDTDGFVETHNVACGVVSKELIKNLQEIFLKMEITSKLTVQKRGGTRKDLYLLRVPKKGLEDYYNKVGFSNPLKREALLSIIKKTGVPRFELGS